MRIGLLGGSFDPVHYGHLLLAECCRESAELDQVWFLPAALPPHKQDRQLSPAADRDTMLHLAIAGHPAFRVCDLELKRGGLSYTVETLEQLHGEHPAVQWFFLMGADSLGDLPGWREPDRICQLASLLVVARPDWPAPDYDALRHLIPPDQLQEISQKQVSMPLLQFSSRELRDRVAQGLSIRYRTPRAVETYISEHGLYRVES